MVRISATTKDHLMVILPLAALIGAILILVLEQAEFVNLQIFQAFCIFLIGAYGGIRGQGEKERKNNPLTLPSGVIRLLFGIAFLIVGIIYAQPGAIYEKFTFIMTLCAECFGLSVPGLYTNK